MTAPFVLPPEALRRVCCSLLVAAQDALVRRGQIGWETAQVLRDPRRDAAAIDALAVDEADLGFDSLSRLDVVMQVSRFFGLERTGIDDYLLVQRHLGDWVRLLSVHQVQPAWRDDPGFCFATSGSAGPVKHLRHALRDLLGEVDAAHAAGLGPLARTTRVMPVVPAHHIYGFLWGVLYPARAGLPVVPAADRAPGFVTRTAQADDLVIATPFLWERICEARTPFAPGVGGLVSGGPSTPALWQTVRAAGVDTLMEIYGATETGGIGTRTADAAPFALMPHLEEGPMSTLHRVGDTAPLPLQDRLAFAAPSQFAVCGRIDDVVQVAGVNVSPAAVADAIRAVPGVAETAVRHDGARLKAFVVPAEGVAPEALCADVRAHLGAVLPASARPASIATGAALPRNAMGKLCDWPDAVTPEPAARHAEAPVADQAQMLAPAAVDAK